MRTILIIIAMMFISSCVFAQECSGTNQQQTGGSQACNYVPNDALLGLNGCSQVSNNCPAPGTNIVLDSCFDMNQSNKVYMSVSSTVGATGQCNQFFVCPPQFSITVTHAANSNDYDRFYNYGYDTALVAQNNCPRTGGWRQDFHQCQGIACVVQQSNVCQPNPPSPPYGNQNGAQGQYMTWDTSSCSWVWANACGSTVCASPIIVDTSGSGFHLTSMEEGAKFDIYADGTPIQTAWTDSKFDNAFLALDRNGNGIIDGGEELFGDHTPQSPCPHPNGFRALEEFDKPENGGNGDGVIDEHDAVYSHLLLWIDKNHDGISQPEELHHLADLGVYSLSLKHTMTPHKDQFGNLFRYKGTVNPEGQPKTDKINRVDYDVFLLTKS